MNHGNIYKAEKVWILSVNQKLNRTLMKNYRIGKYNVVGYDSETKTVCEFYSARKQKLPENFFNILILCGPSHQSPKT